MTFLRIVVPVLGEGLSLADNLRALRPLRDRGAELVVVDGGSTDETWAVACAHADRVLLAPRGRGSQMSAGARGTTAQVLLFLHADTALPDRADRWISDALSRGFVWGRFDVRIDGAHPMLRIVERLVNWRSRLTGIATGDQAIFVERETFQRIGGFADLALMEDVDLSARLKRIGRPACIPAVGATSGRRWMKHGVWRTIVKMWQLRLRYFLGADPRQLADDYGYARRPEPAGAAVAIMAKAPVAGLAKTRLIPAIGPQGAARAQRRFAIDAQRVARTAALGPVTMWCTPHPGHRFFRALHERTGIVLEQQGEGDLGHRLRQVMDRHFAARSDLPLLIIGTDCAVLSPGHLQEAARALVDHDAVIIPAEDGGYVLIGMRRPVARVFEDIDWSTPRVVQQTRERLAGARASWCELPPSWDVDEPADWQRLQRLRGADTICETCPPSIASEPNPCRSSNPFRKMRACGTSSA